METTEIISTNDQNFPESGFLTENTIKKVTLSFLKSYYKFRPRKHTEPTIASIDMHADGNIIADGFYSYKLPNGKAFLSTFEATSYYTKKEITYRPQKQLLTFDGFATAAVFGAFLFSYGYFYNYFEVNALGATTTGILTGLVIFAIMLLYFFIAKNFSRYRYIYAVEQFKKYHADEQWISIGHDVFSNPEDRYYKELKNQCVYNGFGLIVVNQSLQPKLMITPSREEVFKGKRRKRSFKAKSTTSSIPNNKYTKWWHQLNQRMPIRPDGELSLTRFAETFTKQILVGSIAMMLIGGILYKEMLYVDRVVADKAEHVEELAMISTKVQPESKASMIDSTYLNNEKTLPQNHDWWELKNQGERNVLAENNEASKLPIEESFTEKSPTQNMIEVIMSMPDGSLIEYFCDRIGDFRQAKYALVEDQYADLSLAQVRLNQLHQKQLKINALWMGCLQNDEQEYVLFFHELYNTEEEAIEQLLPTIAAAESVNIKLPNLKISKFQFVDANN